MGGGGGVDKLSERGMKRSYSNSNRDTHTHTGVYETVTNVPWYIEYALTYIRLYTSRRSDIRGIDMQASNSTIPRIVIRQLGAWWRQRVTAHNDIRKCDII